MDAMQKTMASSRRITPWCGYLGEVAGGAALAKWRFLTTSRRACGE